MMNFEELDPTTRRHMLAEFEAEQSGGNAYFSKGLTQWGRTAFPALMREAIARGHVVSLVTTLVDPEYWHPTENYERDGVFRERRVNVQQAAERLGLSEFNTWYVRGLAKRLLHEGVSHCQAYRAAMPKWEPGECSTHEGKVYAVELIYRGHRARYWPIQNTSAIAIPFGPGCHHTIRRFLGHPNEG